MTWPVARLTIPRMDGYTDLPIVAVTALHDVDGVAPQPQNLGVHKCLAKPFDVAELLAVVEQLARSSAGARLANPQ